MSSSKGYRREKQAAELYERAGYETFRPPRTQYDETDMFNLFDLLAIHSERIHPVVCQVKSNRAEGITQWFEDAQALCGHCMTRIQYLVAHDNHGWRLAEEAGMGNYEWYVDERDEDGAMGDMIVEYLGGDVE